MTLNLLLMLLLTYMYVYFSGINDSNSILVPEKRPNRFQGGGNVCLLPVVYTKIDFLSQLLMKVQGIYHIVEVGILFFFISNFLRGCKMLPVHSW